MVPGSIGRGRPGRSEAPGNLGLQGNSEGLAARPAAQMEQIRTALASEQARMREEAARQRTEA